jgi:hypothetical protein
MRVGDVVEFSLTGNGPNGRSITIVCQTHGHVMQINGDQIIVEFSRQEGEWEICATRGRFQQGEGHLWHLRLD